MADTGAALKVTAISASAQLGGTERMLLDFANRAFEHDIALRVVTPLGGPLVRILKNIGVPTEVVPAPHLMLEGSQQVGYLRSIPPALLGVGRWSRRLAKHEFIRDADVCYSIAFKPHLAVALARKHPVVWHLHEFPPETTGAIWRRLAHWIPDGLIANSQVVGSAWGFGEAGSGRREAGSGKREAGSAQRAAGSGRREAPRGTGNGERGTAGEAPRSVVVPNGINLDRFKPAERTHWIHDRLSIPREHRLIGMPAVFARWKGQLEVIHAFERITDEFPDVHLIIVGGSIYDTLAEQQYGKELMLEIDRAATGEWQVVSTGGAGSVQREAGSGMRDAGCVQGEAGSEFPRLHHLPFQKKIETVYPEFDFAVHYSTRPEPFGRVVVEAMACAVPVIAADEGGPREILGGGIGSRREAGWLAEPRNPDALADVFRTALELPHELTRSIGEAGRRRAEDHYSWRRFATDVAAVLRRAAAGSE